MWFTVVLVAGVEVVVVFDKVVVGVITMKGGGNGVVGVEGEDADKDNEVDRELERDGSRIAVGSGKPLLVLVLLLVGDGLVTSTIVCY